MAGRREGLALRAATGLEGGLVACGSTCGVVTGGALGIALMRMNGLEDMREETRSAVMKEAREYVDWFHDSFRTTLCRERTSVDFYRMKGQLRYFLPDAVGKCLWHTGKAASRLNFMSRKQTVDSDESAAGQDSESVHCAAEVLQGVRESCGAGDAFLEKIAFVLDGGVALSGGVCGAMAGAVMAANLVFGWDIREMSYPRTIREFVRGHLNLLKRLPSESPETFTIGREIMRRLRVREPVLECSCITGRTFSGWDDFQTHVRSSSRCRSLIDEAIDAAVQAIRLHRAR